VSLGRFHPSPVSGALGVAPATPSAEVRRTVPHHLVDVLDPTEDCTVQWFQHAARAAIDDILARGRIPFLVGGSGLYFRAVVDPLEFPPTDPAVRASVNLRWKDDPAGAHAALEAVDPAAAARIDPQNLRRTVRALEVLELTGRPFSAWRRAWEDYGSVFGVLRVLGVSVSRAELATRIDQRVEAMLAAGWLDECRALARLDLSTTARQAIGYAELFDHLDGEGTLAAAEERIKVRTRRYAARQQRWFAADPRIRWAPSHDIPELLLACIS
jgi:tRNA dimethylallyltransferase